MRMCGVSARGPACLSACLSSAYAQVAARNRAQPINGAFVSSAHKVHKHTHLPRHPHAALRIPHLIPERMARIEALVDACGRRPAHAHGRRLARCSRRGTCVGCALPGSYTQMGSGKAIGDMEQSAGDDEAGGPGKACPDERG